MLFTYFYSASQLSETLYKSSISHTYILSARRLSDSAKNLTFCPLTSSSLISFSQIIGGGKTYRLRLLPKRSSMESRAKSCQACTGNSPIIFNKYLLRIVKSVEFTLPSPFKSPAASPFSDTSKIFSRYLFMTVKSVEFI